MDRKLRQNSGVLFLGLVICLSVWHIISGPGPPISMIAASTPYTLHTQNHTYLHPIATLNASDYSQLINVKDFSFKILNSVCNETSYPLLLIMVHTAPRNFEKRKAIRETWGRSRDNMKLLFMLGLVSEPSLQIELEKENERFGDFVQGTFMDAYRNVTYKHIMVFKYAIYHCPQAKYILKTDDDIFVNIAAYMDFLTEELSPYGASNLLLCNVQKGSKALRTYRSKWRVSFKEYPYRYYPNYCPGWTILYSNDMVFKLYKEAQKQSYFWIDDVLITGILMAKLNLTQAHNAKYIMSKENHLAIISENSTAPIPPFLYGREQLTESHIRRLWDYVQRVKGKSEVTNQNLVITTHS